MNRKSLPEQPIKTIAKRTTIYLPDKFKLEKPTSEINEKLNLLTTLLSDDTGTICNHFIFDTFKPLLNTDQQVKSYQININDHHRLALAKIRQQTGLTVSKLTEYCFTHQVGGSQ